MSIEVCELDPSNQALWQAYVDESPQATFFHRPEWQSVLQESFRHRCYFLMAVEDGRALGILPLVFVKSFLFGNRLVSTAFCVGGGIAADNGAAHDALSRRANELMREVGAEYVEYRAPATSGEGWVRREGLYATFDREIEAAEEDCLKQIPRKQRAVLRKAFKQELETRIDDSADVFYDLYSLSMRNLGTPVFTRRYIDALLAAFGEDCDILTVYGKDGTPLSSVLNFYFRDRVMPYYTGAAPQARKQGAADLMYWEVMRRAVDRGYKVFDFGRSKLGTGPFSFKKNWGFEPKPINLEFSLADGREMPNVNPNNPKYKLFIDTWRKLPHPVANLVGPVVARHLG